MKRIILAATVIILSSCNNQEPVKEVSQKEYILEVGIQQIKINEYSIDGCQYIGKLNGDSRTCYLTHKGNCTNTIHTLQ